MEDQHTSDCLETQPTTLDIQPIYTTLQYCKYKPKSIIMIQNLTQSQHSTNKDWVYYYVTLRISKQL